MEAMVTVLSLYQPPLLKATTAISPRQQLSWHCLVHSSLQPRHLSSSSSDNNTITCSSNDMHASGSTLLANVPADAGLLFRQKLVYLEKNLQVDPLVALAKNPKFRSAPLESLTSVESCLLQTGLNHDDIGRILTHHPDLLTCDLDRTIYPVLAFLLKEVGVPFSGLHVALIRCPRLLVSSVDHQLRPTFYFLRKLGFFYTGPHSRFSRDTLLLISSVEHTIIPKLDYLQKSLSFPHRDLIRMVLRSPALLTFSIDKNLQPKFDYFNSTMGRNLEELKEFPHYFSFSLHGRIKPRHEKLVGLGWSPSLSDMLTPSNGRFEELLMEMRLKLVENKMS